VPDPVGDPRLARILDLVLEVAEGHYSERLEPSDAADDVDAVTVGVNLVAESLELERDRRRRAEALLRDEVHGYEEAPAMFCSLDAGLDIVKCNETLARSLGVAREDLIERRFLAFLAAEEREAAEAALREIRSGQTPARSTFHLQPPSGDRIPVLLSGSPTDDGTERIRLVLRDVSAERSLEAQLRQAQKLEAVGRLASGVAHDFNNILAVVLGSAGLLKKLLPQDHRGQAELSAIINAAENGSRLTSQLLSLSRPHPEGTASLADIHQMIRDTQPLLQRSLGSNSTLVLDLAPQPLLVRLEAGHLVQVLLNLTINARDAMPAGGSLTVRTTPTTDAQGNAVVALDVEDTGSGIASDVLDQVFDPFFTTKETSGGSGLGLAVCLRIVQQWRGTLEIHSSDGTGTRVRMTLPLADPSTPDERPPHAVQSRSKPRAPTILVVDDDKLVRNFLVRTLKEEGYRVLDADGMASALERVARADGISLVVTDVVMPGGTGVDLANELWEDSPDLPVIFVSGYTDNQISRQLLARPNVSFLAKPFSPDDLVELVVQVLPAAGEPDGR